MDVRKGNQIMTIKKRRNDDSGCDYVIDPDISYN